MKLYGVYAFYSEEVVCTDNQMKDMSFELLM